MGIMDINHNKFILIFLCLLSLMKLSYGVKTAVTCPSNWPSSFECTDPGPTCKTSTDCCCDKTPYFPPMMDPMNFNKSINSHCDNDNDGVADGDVACDPDDGRCILCGSNDPTTTKTTTTVTIPTTSASDKSFCGFILFQVALIPFLYGLN